MGSYFDERKARGELAAHMDLLALALRAGSVELFEHGEWLTLLQAAADLAGELARHRPEEG